ncbi:MAG: MBL fold metallo-hydrolase [Syntrophales bacterium]
MDILQALVMLMAIAAPAAGESGNLETDVIQTATGDLSITFIGHSSLYFTFNGKVIYNDPVGKAEDYKRLPKADVILVSHDHFDHFDPNTIKLISTEKTKIVLTEPCFLKLGRGEVLKNGDTTTIDGLTIEAVPAYNILHTRAPGQPFHPKGSGNGYIVTFGDKRVYIAGDTENIKEMGSFGKIDVAFLPMNLPYTMTPEMVATAARILSPAILYPYHYGETDTSRIVFLLKADKGIEVRIRRMP